MGDAPADAWLPPAFLSNWPVRVALALSVAAGFTLHMVFVAGWRRTEALVYNVPIFAVFGLWLTVAAGWLWRWRWRQLAIGAAALTAVFLRLRTANGASGFPASGHVTFLTYVLVATRRDPVLFWPAVAVLLEVVVIKITRRDYTSLVAGVVLGLILGLAARALAHRREARPPRLVDRR